MRVQLSRELTTGHHGIGNNDCYYGKKVLLNKCNQNYGQPLHLLKVKLAMVPATNHRLYMDNGDSHNTVNGCKNSQKFIQLTFQTCL